jgi:hypothetical protein
MGYYVFFARNQLNSSQKDSSNNSTVAIPTITEAIPATIDEVNISSPGAEINEIEKDLEGL